MAGILVSPGFDDAVRKRSSSYKRKGGSPSFKEILRKRCKERIKARRCALLNQFRNLNCDENVKEIIYTMAREEASVLSSGYENSTQHRYDDMELDIHPLEDATLNKFEEWLLHEYDRIMEEELQEDISAVDQDICPICLKSPLKAHNDCSMCASCRIQLPRLNVLKPALESAYANHSLTSCQNTPSCAIIQNSLFLVCAECSCVFNIIDIK